MLIRVLLAVQPARDRKRLARLLERQGVALLEAPARGGFWDALNREDVDLLVVSRSMLPEPPAARIARIRELPERPQVIVVDDRDDPRERAELTAAGALAVLGVAIGDEVLGETLRALIERRLEEVARAGPEPETRAGLSDFVSSSPAMQKFLAIARRVVPTDSSLLILGETGTGKERLARAIHAEGPRAQGPFIPLNCGAIPESLLESELFGHERGAFTGADRARRGYFELAHGGTIFLDEVGEMPLHLQVKLLRVLEDRKVQRVGGERSADVNVRVIAATNKDLEAEVAAKRFRQDLYFRLAVVTLTLPPVRERREDIEPLVRSYLDFFNLRLGRRLTGITREALEALGAYDWPGNVREIINVMEQVVLLASGPEIEAADLPHRIDSRSAPRGTAAPENGPAERADLGRPLRAARREIVNAFERDYLSGLLRQTRGRIGEAAARAGINPRSLHTLMRRHNLRKEDFK